MKPLLATLITLASLLLATSASLAADYDPRAQFDSLIRAEQAAKAGDLPGAKRIADEVFAAARKAYPDEGGDERILSSVMGTYAAIKQWSDWEQVGKLLLANAERNARRDGRPDATWPIRERLAAGYLRQGRFAEADGQVAALVQSANDAARSAAGVSKDTPRMLERLGKQYADQGRPDDAARLQREAARFRALLEGDNARDDAAVREAERIIKGR